EDGIRDRNVTGVQTCALPISRWHPGGRVFAGLGPALYSAGPGLFSRYETPGVFPHTSRVHYARRWHHADPAGPDHGHRAVERLGQPAANLVCQRSEITNLTTTQRQQQQQPSLPKLGFKGTLRFIWTHLTSMRTALMLLLLLALAAVPGSLFPQRRAGEGIVDTWIEDNPTLGPILDALGMFDVYTTPWFAAAWTPASQNVAAAPGSDTAQPAPFARIRPAGPGSRWTHAGPSPGGCRKSLEESRLPHRTARGVGGRRTRLHPRNWQHRVPL